MKKSDCIRCKVAQSEFGEYCSLCHFTDKTNKSLQKTNNEDEFDVEIQRLARLLTWVSIITLFLLAGIFIAVRTN